MIDLILPLHQRNVYEALYTQCFAEKKPVQATRAGFEVKSIVYHPTQDFINLYMYRVFQKSTHFEISKTWWYSEH